MEDNGVSFELIQSNPGLRKSLCLFQDGLFIVVGPYHFHPKRKLQFSVNRAASTKINFLTQGEDDASENRMRYERG